MLSWSALASAELISRRLVLIGDARRLSPAAPDYSVAGRYMGWGFRGRGAWVDPALSRRVSDALRSEAAVVKES
eukprot:11025963-Lingulodinium_polyedra.AAC.1